MKNMLKRDSYSLLLKYTELGLVSTELATGLWSQARRLQLPFFGLPISSVSVPQPKLKPREWPSGSQGCLRASREIARYPPVTNNPFLAMNTQTNISFPQKWKYAMEILDFKDILWLSMGSLIPLEELLLHGALSQVTSRLWHLRARCFQMCV